MVTRCGLATTSLNYQIEIKSWLEACATCLRVINNLHRWTLIPVTRPQGNEMNTDGFLKSFKSVLCLATFGGQAERNVGLLCSHKKVNTKLSLATSTVGRCRSRRSMELPLVLRATSSTEGCWKGKRKAQTDTRPLSRRLLLILLVPPEVDHASW